MLVCMCGRTVAEVMNLQVLRAAIWTDLYSRIWVSGIDESQLDEPLRGLKMPAALAWLQFIKLRTAPPRMLYLAWHTEWLPLRINSLLWHIWLFPALRRSVRKRSRCALANHESISPGVNMGIFRWHKGASSYRNL